VRPWWLLALVLSGCAASAEFHKMREFVDAEGKTFVLMSKVGEVKGRAFFGGFRAKMGEMELEYIPGVRVPDIMPIAR